VQRDRATVLLEQLLERVVGTDWPIALVNEVHVFGSYARGSVAPGDVDVAVHLKRGDERWTQHVIHCMSYGRDPHAVLRKALRGAARSVSILVDPTDGYDDVPMTLLWRRGEPLADALQRLHAIPPDPNAGRAPRDAMRPCFAGLDHWLPRFVREELITLAENGAIAMEQLILPDSVVDNQSVRQLIDDRWTATSPLRRAAHAVIGYLEQRAVDITRVYLHGHDIGEEVTPYLVGFELTYFAAMMRLFQEYGGREWVEVVHPTRTKTLRALRVTLRDSAEVAAWRPTPTTYFT
jgi:hypothetical protein